MRILIVNTYYYPNMVGGTEQSIKLLAEELYNKGHIITVLTGDGEEERTELINNIRVIRLCLKNKNENILGKIKRKSLEFNNIMVVKRILNILDDVKPQVIHTNNMFNLSPIIWSIAKKRNIKIVHTLRDYWGLCPKTTLLNKKSEICNKKKILCKIHQKNYWNFSKKVDIVTAPSQFTLDIYKRENMFLNSKMIMIPNAIDYDLERYKEIVSKRLKNNNKIVKFLFVGKLDVHKGIKFLIEAFKQIKNEDIRLLICGYGPLEEYVKKSEEFDYRIKFLGKVIGDEKEKILLQSDVMIVPSIWYEPFGRVIIEAYKYGLPTIGCNIGGIKEIINENVGIGIEINSKDQLIEAISKLSSREDLKKYIEHTGENLKKYNLKEQIDKFEEIYKQ